jgi:hypothetical protein
VCSKARKASPAAACKALRFEAHRLHRGAFVVDLREGEEGESVGGVKRGARQARERERDRRERASWLLGVPEMRWIMRRCCRRGIW